MLVRRPSTISFVIPSGSILKWRRGGSKGEFRIGLSITTERMAARPSGPNCPAVRTLSGIAGNQKTGNTGNFPVSPVVRLFLRHAADEDAAEEGGIVEVRPFELGQRDRVADIDHRSAAAGRGGEDVGPAVAVEVAGA